MTHGSSRLDNNSSYFPNSNSQMVILVYYPSSVYLKSLLEKHILERENFHHGALFTYYLTTIHSVKLSLSPDAGHKTRGISPYCDTISDPRI